jgi:ABC-type Zn uptake system ZnuABC Zn-binding protein ZnuA
MRKFLDERGYIITLDELQKEFIELQQENPDEYNYSFNEYIKNCTCKNGTLTEIKDTRNIEGLKRDILCSIEHFQDIEKAKEYILQEFAREYTKEEIEKVFEEVKNYGRKNN